MKTDDLISLLATDVQAVAPSATAARFTAAIAIGTLISLIFVLGYFGARADLAEVAMTADFLFKVGVPAAVALASGMALYRLGHPGMKLGLSIKACMAPIALLWLWAAWSLINTPPDARMGVVLGQTWRVCTLNIAMIAAPLWLATFWLLKGLAPTQPRLAGAVAGWFAGALSAIVYALHCPEMAAPFNAVWGVLGMSIPALIGAWLGPRLLRW